MDLFELDYLIKISGIYQGYIWYIPDNLDIPGISLIYLVYPDISLRYFDYLTKIPGI